MISIDELSPEDIVIAVAGTSGSGKSSFMQLLTDMHQQDDPTSVAKFVVLGTVSAPPWLSKASDTVRTVLLMLPSVAGPAEVDATGARHIITRLTALNRAGISLTGLIYLHSKSESRMPSTSLRNLRFQKQRCGEDFFRNIVFVTTIWERVGLEHGEAHEKALMDSKDFWAPVRARSGHVSRPQGSRWAAAMSIVNTLVAYQPASMHVQREIVLDGIGLEDTHAGSALIEDLEKLKAENMDAIQG